MTYSLNRLKNPRNLLKKPSKQTAIIMIIVLIGLSGFYWLALRPSMIKKECNKIASEIAKGSSELVQTPYVDEVPTFYGGRLTGDYHLETNYKLERRDRSVETFTAVYTACTSQKGI